MHKVLSGIVAVLSAAIIISPAVAVAPQPAAAAERVSTLDLLDQLAVKSGGHSTAYDRDYFKHWIDADRNGCNTRASVLVSESTTKTTRTSSCTIKTGRWVSKYDGKVVTSAGDLDIDHMVPLAEAWHSGAGAWSTTRRTAFANDMYSHSLIAVTASTNRSKGSDDPGEWMPPKTSFHCSYAKMWVAVKYRWKLTVDSREKNALVDTLNACSDDTIVFAARPTEEQVKQLAGWTAPSAPSTGGGGGGGSTDPRYSTCTAAKSAGANTPYYRGTDPEYAWYDDRDNDGIVCE